MELSRFLYQLAEQNQQAADQFYYQALMVYATGRCESFFIYKHIHSGFEKAEKRQSLGFMWYHRVSLPTIPCNGGLSKRCSDERDKRWRCPWIRAIIFIIPTELICRGRPTSCRHCCGSSHT